MVQRLLGVLRAHAYAIDFVLFPVVAILLIAMQCRSIGWASAAVAGFVLFTFAEYCVHRWALHGVFFGKHHARHHTHPEEYVTFPLWFTPSVFVFAFLIMPTSLFAGFVLGYVWFMVWHHVLHHVDLTKWPAFAQYYAAWHMRHHNADEVNFGICTNVWDRVFGTYRA